MPTYIAGVQAVAIAASTTKTLAQIATQSTRRGWIKEFGISFNGLDATKTPVRVQLLRQTTAGTASSLTTVKVDPAETASITLAQQTFTVEPTAGDILWSEEITPAGGFDRVQIPLGEEFVIAASGWCGIRVIPASDLPASVVATAYIRFQE